MHVCVTGGWRVRRWKLALTKYMAFQAKTIIKLERNLTDLNAYYQLINSFAKILCKFMAEQGVVFTVEGIVPC